MKIIGQNFRGEQILSPEVVGLCHILKQSVLFDWQLNLVMKSIKFHCRKMMK